MSFTELEYALAKDLAANGVGLVFGTGTPANRNIFVGEFGTEPQEGVMLVAIPSPPPHQYIDTEYPIVDFWSRSAHTDRSKALLRQVFELYHRRYSYDADNWHIYFSQALGNIVDADRDSEGGKLFRLSVQFYCRNLNHVS